MALMPNNAILKRKNKFGETKIVDSASLEDLNHNLSLYQDPPTETISIEEFHEIGYKRLRVLQILRDLKETHKYGSEDFINAFVKKVRPIMPILVNSSSAAQVTEDRRHDRISHFILRMAFCKSKDQINEFCQAELELFRLRFGLETRDNVKNFLKVNNLKPEDVIDEEKYRLAPELSQASRIPEAAIKNTDFWKVEFFKAFELIRNRKAYLSKGWLYITFDELVTVVVSRFRYIMQLTMNREAMYLKMNGEDERIGPLLSRMVRNVAASEYKKPANAKEITVDMIEELSKTSFPPCMRQIHYHLRKEHHLRHFARRQYGLFLKDAGMSLHSSLEFFRREFTKKMDANKFDKEHGYNIRHIYGKEGSHREGKAYNCLSIINNNPPGTLDCHGCPFKHCESQILSQRLELMGLNKAQIADVACEVKIQRYDRACAKTFEYQHKMQPGALGTIITHPNQYFTMSREIYDGKRATNIIETKKIELKVKNSKEEEGDDFDENMEF